MACIKCSRAQLPSSAGWCHHSPQLEQTFLSWPSWYSPDTSHQGLGTAHFQVRVLLDKENNKCFAYGVSQELFTPAELVKNEDSLRRPGRAFYCWLRLPSPLVKPLGSCSQLQKAPCVFSTTQAKLAQSNNRYLVAYSGQSKWASCCGLQTELLPFSTQQDFSILKPRTMLTIRDSNLSHTPRSQFT